MKARTVFRLAWSVWLATVAFLAGAVVLAISSHAPLGLNDLSLMIVFLCFATVGAVIASRRGSNAVGWLCSAMALAAFLGAFASEYGHYAVAHPGSLPAANMVAWFAVWTWFATVGLLSTFLLLLFPSGHLPSPRWRPVAWMAGATLVTICLAAATTPYPPEAGMLSNPLAVEQLGWAQELVWAVGLPALGVLVLASTVSLIARFRQARGEERQQLKWFTYAAALLGLLTAAGAVSATLDNRIPDPVHNASLAAIPIAIGIAILRYRLYDIDRIINRTLVYGLLTTLLVGVYAAMVLVLGQFFGGVGGDPPSWAVAGATLAVAALFQPARHRIQGSSIDASTVVSTTRPRRSRHSPSGCVMRSTWTRSRPSSWPWPTRPCSRLWRGCGFDPQPSECSASEPEQAPSQASTLARPWPVPGRRARRGRLRGSRRGCSRPRTAAAGGRPQGRP